MPHERLLLKLEALGISGMLFKWSCSFLTCRFQRVMINGSHSQWLPVSSGVRQSSVLDPLLFCCILMIFRKSSNIFLLRFLLHDDVALYEKVLSLSDCVQLQEDLNSILLWAICWQLHLSPSKCEALLISKYHIATHGSLFGLLMMK